MSRMSLEGLLSNRYLPENCDNFNPEASLLLTEKVAGSEGELKCAVTPFDVWLKGVL